MKKSTNKKPRSHHKKGANLLWYFMALVIFFTAVAAGMIFATTSLFDKPTRPSHRPIKHTMLVATDKTTVLIMGVDTREDDVGRSDTMMVAMLDPKKNQAALLSVPRDTRMRIRGLGWEKINSAYSFGGRELSMEAVEDLLGTPIDHYVLVNNRAFKKIIDAIDGIDIDVEKRMEYEDPWDSDGGLVIDLYPGYQHLNGKQAIGYVRYRDEEGDIGRISRQQKFMKAVMDKVASPGIITDIPEIIDIVSSNVETDLTLRQMAELAGSLRDAQKNGLKSAMVPGDPVYIDEVSYWIPDIERTRETVAQILDIPINQHIRSDMEQTAAEYRNSLPSHTVRQETIDRETGRDDGPTIKRAKPTPRQSADERRNARRRAADEEYEKYKEEAAPLGPPSRHGGTKAVAPPRPPVAEDDEEEDESESEPEQAAETTPPPAPKPPRPVVAPSAGPRPGGGKTK